MSAIAGIFHRDGQPAAESCLRAMTATLATVGPRSENFWLRGNVGFGHRLSWFTKEDEFEKQPLTSRDGRFTLVAAARIDNRRELAELLGISSAESRLLPDSAFIMAAFEKWGEACLSRLIGSFALAMYNHTNGTLLLARDPRGDNPLYYWTDGRSLAFASAPRALFALGFIPRRINLQRAADHLVMMPRRGPDSSSWYEGLASPAPGSALTVTSSGIQVKEFWRLDPNRKVRYARDSDYVEAFSELWDRVVVSQARSRAGTGILMSGGLDSTSIAAVVAPFLGQTGRRLSSFTAVPPSDFAGAVPFGWYADETPYVRAMARTFPNVDLNFITMEKRFFLDGIERYFAAAEAPLRTGFNRPWFDAICSSAAEQEVPVLLTGQAGNLTISWYGNHLMPQLVLGGHWLRALREARALVRTGIARSTPAAVAAALLPSLPGPLWSAVLRARHGNRPVYSSTAPWKVRSLIAPEFAKEQHVAERARESGYDFRFRPRRDIRTLVLGSALAEGDGSRALESLFGVQLRSPAADPRIVEFCLGIPEEQFLRNGVTRWLIRRAMRDKLPEEILNNRLRGFQSATWADRLALGTTRLSDEIESLQRSPLVRHIIDLPRLRALVNRLQEKKDESASFLATIAASALMTARFLGWAELGT